MVQVPLYSLQAQNLMNIVTIKFLQSRVATVSSKHIKNSKCDLERHAEGT